MAELIVLGQIPGTSFEITLNWVLLGSALLLSAYAAAHVLRRHRQMQATQPPAATQTVVLEQVSLF